MASKVRVTVSIDRQVAARVDAASRVRRTSRSQLFEEAIRQWEQALLEEELGAGYRSMAEDDRETAKRTLAAQWEVIR